MIYTKPKFKLYSTDYLNAKAVKNNFLLKYIYGQFYPIAFILYITKLSPNQLTLVGLLTGIFSSYCILSSQFSLFYFFWFLTIALDFSDGTVARMTNNISKAVIRFDHMSDLIKIFFITLSSSMVYMDKKLFLISFLFIFLLMYFDILNKQLETYYKLSPKVTNKMRDLNTINNDLIGMVWVKNIYNVFFTINGHTLFLFFFLANGAKASFLLFLYLCAVLSLNITLIFFKLIRLEKV